MVLRNRRTLLFWLKVATAIVKLIQSILRVFCAS
jgi:hypothetical protein